MYILIIKNMGKGGASMEYLLNGVISINSHQDDDGGGCGKYEKSCEKVRPCPPKAMPLGTIKIKK